METSAYARALRVLNRWFMVPALRAGLGAWLSTPFGGWIVLLRVRGRRSGMLRDVPLSYLVLDGAAWVLAGFGPGTQWYRNVLVDPVVQVRLPGRAPAWMRASPTADPAVRLRVVPRLMRAAGLPALGGGVNPWRDTDDRLAASVSEVPLLALRPLDGTTVVAGPEDPGGQAWVWRQGVLAAATMAVLAGLARAVRR